MDAATVAAHFYLSPGGLNAAVAVTTAGVARPRPPACFRLALTTRDTGRHRPRALR
jgi:hypothetical protein